MFPKQFDTIPHIIIWTIVFLADIALVFVAAWQLGIPLPIGGTWGQDRTDPVSGGCLRPVLSGKLSLQ